jgi:hypothetical protein
LWFNLLASGFFRELAAALRRSVSNGHFALLHKPMAFRGGNDRPSWRYQVKAHAFRTSRSS